MDRSVTRIITGGLVSQLNFISMYLVDSVKRAL